MSMEAEIKDEMEAFRASVTKSAEDIIFKTFPRKILDLQKLLDTTSSPSSPFHISHAESFTDATVYPDPASSLLHAKVKTEVDTTVKEPETKKRKRGAAADKDHSPARAQPIDVDHPMTNGANGGGMGGAGSVNSVMWARYPNLMKGNEHVHKVNGQVKQYAEELVALTDQVKLWINLTMPRIEDGDNFGVQIQEEVLSELHRSQESGYNLRDACRLHHLGRAKICSKILKYPNLEDYTVSLREHDEKQLYLARQHIVDIRNIYAVMTDILHKNIAKLRAPKGNNRETMY